MKCYRVVLTGKSALKMVNKKTWNGPDYQMSVRDDWMDAKEGQPSDHQGLIYTVELRADNVSSSMDQATGIARRICDELTVVHGAIIEHPKPKLP